MNWGDIELRLNGVPLTGFKDIAYAPNMPEDYNFYQGHPKLGVWIPEFMEWWNIFQFTAVFGFRCIPWFDIQVGMRAPHR